MNTNTQEPHSIYFQAIGDAIQNAFISSYGFDDIQPWGMRYGTHRMRLTRQFIALSNVITNGEKTDTAG